MSPGRLDFASEEVKQVERHQAERLRLAVILVSEGLQGSVRWKIEPNADVQTTTGGSWITVQLFLPEPGEET